MTTKTLFWLFEILKLKTRKQGFGSVLNRMKVRVCARTTYSHDR